nr:HBV pre-s2 binding protein 1 [Homo sapiens]
MGATEVGDENAGTVSAQPCSRQCCLEDFWALLRRHPAPEPPPWTPVLYPLRTSLPSTLAVFLNLGLSFPKTSITSSWRDWTLHLPFAWSLSVRGPSQCVHVRGGGDHIRRRGG